MLGCGGEGVEAEAAAVAGAAVAGGNTALAVSVACAVAVAAGAAGSWRDGPQAAVRVQEQITTVVKGCGVFTAEHPQSAAGIMASPRQQKDPATQAATAAELKE